MRPADLLDCSEDDRANTVWMVNAMCRYVLPYSCNKGETDINDVSFSRGELFLIKILPPWSFHLDAFIPSLNYIPSHPIPLPSTKDNVLLCQYVLHLCYLFTADPAPVSGSPPTAPVVSKTSGTVYEKALIERYIGKLSLARFERR
jgi:hypothetical protein